MSDWTTIHPRDARGREIRISPSGIVVVEDVLPTTTTTDFTTAYVRFVNAISNSAPMTLYAKSTTTGTETAIAARSRTRRAESS